MKELDYDDMTQRGLLVSHCSDPDGGSADVGVSLGLGDNRMLWAGEISSTKHAETDGAAELASDDGWWLILYSHDQGEGLAKFCSAEAAQSFMDQLGAVVRNGTAPDDVTSQGAA